MEVSAFVVFLQPHTMGLPLICQSPHTLLQIKIQTNSTCFSVKYWSAWIIIWCKEWKCNRRKACPLNRVSIQFQIFHCHMYFCGSNCRMLLPTHNPLLTNVFIYGCFFHSNLNNKYPPIPFYQSWMNMFIPWSCVFVLLLKALLDIKRQFVPLNSKPAAIPSWFLCVCLRAMQNSYVVHFNFEHLKILVSYLPVSKLDWQITGDRTLDVVLQLLLKLR